LITETSLQRKQSISSDSSKVFENRPRRITDELFSGSFGNEESPKRKFKTYKQTDYSLPEKFTLGMSVFQSDDGGMRGEDLNGIPNGEHYFLGIIDILMLYTVRKQLEHLYKTLQFGNSQEISSVNPKDYSQRFEKFNMQILTSE